MSHVTDAFLMTSVLFDPEDNVEDAETMKKIDEYFENHFTEQRFKRLDSNDKAYGGSKMMQASVWCGAFNYMGVQEFIEYLKGLEWNDAGWVQFCYQDEHDDGFTLVQILEQEEQ